MNRLKAFFTLLLFATLGVSAQVFPVRTITTVSSPYPTSLDQYANTETGNLSLTIIPTDASLLNYPVKLRLTISGGWFKIYTNPSFIHKSITLNHGESLVFSGADLAQWFNPDNLIFEGYSKAQYLKTGRLPEGVYQVWFEVWDYFRNFNISGTSKAMIWSYENEAPVLNFPQNSTLLTPSDPQNIVFNWTQKQSPYSSAGAGNTFTYELWEIWPDNMNVDEAVTTTKPIYTTTTNATTLNYTAAEPILITGRKYAWRVKVADELGRSQFKNNGYSTVQWFRFGKDCSVTKPVLDKATTSQLAVKWDNNTNVDRYELRWRNKDIENGNWYSKEATSPSATAENLSANTKYELQIKGYCGVQESSYSSSLTASTAEDVACACGNAAAQTTFSTTNPLSSLKKGDVIRAGDFNVLVSSSSGSGGTFSGKGYVLVPYLKFLRFEVTFSGIQLNANHQLTSGEINFVYNEKNGLVLNVSTVINALLSSDDSKPVEKNAYTNTADKKIVSDTTVKSITITAAGDVVVTSVTGAQQVVHTSSGELVAVATSDGEGEQSVVDTKTKTIYKGTADSKGISGGSSSPIQPVTSDSAQYTVNFVAHSQQKCGLDLPADSHPAGNYKSVSIGGKDYLIPWKSVESGTIDYLEATVAGGPADSIHFMTSQGNLVLTAPGSSISNPATTSKQLLVSGADASDELKAWYAEYEKDSGDSAATQKRILAGQVNVVSYSKSSHNLVLVQVNGAASPDVSTVKEYINKTYQGALQEFNISKIDNFKVDFSAYGSTFDNGHDDASLNMFTDPEQAIIEAFSNSTNYNSSNYYLFFIGDITTTDQSLYGYMPFNQHFGFVYRDNPSADRLMHTLVHEPGHGVFGLRHTFSAYNQFMQNKSSTLNVMDYPSSGKELTCNQLLKYQWDLTHDNTQEYSDTESENEIEDKGEISYENYNPLAWTDSQVNQKIEQTITFLAPSGLPISIKGIISKCLVCVKNGGHIMIDGQSKVYALGEGTKVTGNSDKDIITLKQRSAALFGFKLIKNGQEELWSGLFSEDGRFLGYYNFQTKTYYKDEITADLYKKQSYYTVRYWTGDNANPDGIWWGTIQACFNPTDYETYYITKADAYYAEDKYVANLDDAKDILEETCKSDLGVEKAFTLSWSDFSTLKSTMEYKYGKLYTTYETEDGPVTIRCRYDDTSKKNVYEIEVHKNHWQTFPFPSFSDAAFTNIFKLCQASSLELLSVIPGTGVVTGMWYLIKGENSTAILCFIDVVLPEISNVAKIAIQFAKDAELTKKVITLTAESYQSLVKIQKSLKAGETTVSSTTWSLLPQLLSEQASHAKTFEKLANNLEVTDFENVLKSIDDLTNKETFLKDISTTSQDANHLVNNLDKINESTIEAWSVLNQAGEKSAIRASNESITKIKNYFSSNANKTPEQLAKEIKIAGGYENWAAIIDWDRVSKWSYPPPSKALYLKYKTIYDKEKYFNQTTGEIIWPDNKGFKDISKVDTKYNLSKGKIIDRYGGENGSFLAPVEASWAERSLPPFTDRSINPTYEYHKYEVLKDFEVKSGEIAPWFEQTGGGTQYYIEGKQILDKKGNWVDCTINNLVENDYLKRL